ncbi:MinD/ParA family protein [Nocardiopsis sp. CNT312]|uniref:MinD/ParA family ATP-binding protein n=1 Tax=Nocardiopsis sp. CNT312 TaxID=1137268 RepID=UPI0004BBE779|nr:MinD/ParA family protein [Nocardiopsis sp. CNT312]
MAHKEHDGPDLNTGTRDEPLWHPPADDAREEGASDDAGPASAPSPREQWFGGFEGAEAPPPPPYARIPEDDRAPSQEDPPVEPEEGEGPESADGDDGPARLFPDRPEPVRPSLPPRPVRPGAKEAEPFGTGRTRGESDVPEPEQLPPLEVERVDPAPAPTGPAAERSATVPAPGGAPEPDTPWTGQTPVPPRSLAGPRADTAPSQSSPRPAPSPREGGETAESLNTANLVRTRRQGPDGGWRKAVHTMTLGLVTPGESARERRHRELVSRASTPVAGGHHRVAVLSLKGGVGKTTTTVALGATLASLRGDRVLAVDANPDRGTLSDKVRLETSATIRDLLNESHLVSRYADIRGFTSQAPSRLEILASDRDPAVSEAFSEEDYREVARIVEHFYSICITDCGTGLLHSAMRGVLGLADQVVLVSSASVDGARSASATLDWLEAHGYGGLVRGAAVVLSMVRPNSKSSIDLERLEGHFAGRCRTVVRVPWDGHLEEGAEVDLDRLDAGTRDAYLMLAASVGEGFA